MVQTYRFNGCKDDTTIQKVLSNLDYCPIMWSSAARKDPVKLQLAQNRAAHFALNCNQRADINTMHASLSWLRVKERLTASLVLFIRNINVLEIQNCLHSQLTYSTDTHLPHQTCHQGSFHSPQVQNKFEETYSIMQSHECMDSLHTHRTPPHPCLYIMPWIYSTMPRNLLLLFSVPNARDSQFW